MNKILEQLPKNARPIVAEWLKDAREREDPWKTVLTRGIVHTISQWRRADARKLALGFVIRKVNQGETLEHLTQSWEHSGGYFISIGVGTGFMWTKRIKPHEIGVQILGKPAAIFDLRQLYREAHSLLDAKKRGQASLFR